MNAERRLFRPAHLPGVTHHTCTRTSLSRIAGCSLVLVAALALGPSALAQPPAEVPEKAAVQTTLAIFNDRPMPDGLWQALITTLHYDLASNSPEVRGLVVHGMDNEAGSAAAARASSQIQILEGDQIVPGTLIDRPITVYLVGDCKTEPAAQFSNFSPPLPVESGALGWVKMTNGHIEPFIHVDCRRIGQMLRVAGTGLSTEQRNHMMAVAISRVVLHEWIHIASQSPHHSKNGVAKAQFGVSDLLAQPPKPLLLQGTGWQTPTQESGIRLVQSPAPDQRSHSRPWSTK
jgi:hypothetical protein